MNQPAARVPRPREEPYQEVSGRVNYLGRRHVTPQYHITLGIFAAFKMVYSDESDGYSDCAGKFREPRILPP
jgi:hypothetical protein